AVADVLKGRAATTTGQVGTGDGHGLPLLAGIHGVAVARVGPRVHPLGVRAGVLAVVEDFGRLGAVSAEVKAHDDVDGFLFLAHFISPVVRYFVRRSGVMTVSAGSSPTRFATSRSSAFLRAAWSLRAAFGRRMYRSWVRL